MNEPSLRQYEERCGEKNLDAMAVHDMLIGLRHATTKLIMGVLQNGIFQR